MSLSIKSMPKIDLHCHLDGSLTPEFIKKVSSVNLDQSDLIKKLQAPEDCKSLTNYLTCFDLPISCLQTEENITEAILDVLNQAALENIKYIEIRFAPAFSINPNLSYRQIYEAAIKGCALGYEKWSIYSNIILCAMRHFPPETNLAMLHSAMDYIGNGICAIDLAGDESAFSNKEFIDFFVEAKKYKIPFTIHSGECGSWENVRIALELGAKRIGHGIALINNKNLMLECGSKKLGLELCPTSNFQTKATNHVKEYPLKAFLSEGLLATVNTDNRTVSNTSMSKELTLATEKLNIDEKDLIILYKNSIEISFADDNIKNELFKQI